MAAPCLGASGRRPEIQRQVVCWRARIDAQINTIKWLRADAIELFIQMSQEPARGIVGFCTFGAPKPSRWGARVGGPGPAWQGFVALGARLGGPIAAHVHASRAARANRRDIQLLARRPPAASRLFARRLFAGEPQTKLN